MRSLILSLVALTAAGIWAQTPSTKDTPQPKKVEPKPAVKVASPQELERQSILLAEQTGVDVRIKDIARFRGVRGNQLTGIGLVIGLEGTGDSKKSPATLNMLTNYFAELGTKVDPSQLEPKNVALVMVTCELPAFAKPGTSLDVRVASIGDAKSLQGGSLLQTPLYPGTMRDKAFVVAEGPVSIGGFNASSGGNSSQRNHVNVARIPNGGIVEASVSTKFVFSGSKMYLDFDQQDMTTVHRAAMRIAEQYPQLSPESMDGATISVVVPSGLDPVAVISMIESIRVNADVDAKVVMNERTGTIVMGGNVSIAPCAVAQGSLQVKIEVEERVVPAAPFTPGTSEKETNTRVDANQETAKVALIGPKTTVADLARILQTLKLKPTDIISILQTLRQQGALKARIELQ